MTTLEGAPKPTGRNFEVTIVGMFVAFDAEHVVTLTPHGAPDQLLVPVFSDESNLRAAMERLGIRIHRIVRIDDQEEFLASLQGFGFRVIVDLHWTPEGRVRYVELKA